jgi:hypothetical protein
MPPTHLSRHHACAHQTHARRHAHRRCHTWLPTTTLARQCNSLATVANNMATVATQQREKESRDGGTHACTHTHTSCSSCTLVEDEVLALKLCNVRQAQPHTRGQRAPPRAKRAPHLGLMTPSSSEEPRCRSSRTLCPRTHPVLVPLHCSATRWSLKPTGVTFF